MVMNKTTSEPLDWIQLDLVPLINFESIYAPITIWWNPQAGLLEGDNTDFVLNLVEKAIQKGSVNHNVYGSVELTDPLKKPTELAAILGQFFWLVPQPVSKPYEYAEIIQPIDEYSACTTLQ